jgi:hypothetical protein
VTNSKNFYKRKRWVETHGNLFGTITYSRRVQEKLFQAISSRLYRFILFILYIYIYFYFVLIKIAKIFDLALAYVYWQRGDVALADTQFRTCISLSQVPNQTSIPNAGHLCREAGMVGEKKSKD